MKDDGWVLAPHHCQFIHWVWWAWKWGRYCVDLEQVTRRLMEG